MKKIHYVLKKALVILSPSACSSIYGTKNKQNKTVKYKKDKKILTKQSINATHFKVGSTYKVCRRCEKVLDMGNYILLTDFLGLPIMPMHFKSLVYVFTLHNQNNKKNKTKTIPFCFHHTGTSYIIIPVTKNNKITIPDLRRE